MKKNNNLDNKNKHNINWNETNELTRAAYKVDQKRTSFHKFLISLIVFFIIFSLIGGVTYGIKIAYDNVKYQNIPLYLTMPEISPIDLKDEKIYDSDTSITLNILENIINDKIPVLLDLNPILNFLINIRNYDVNKITIKLYNSDNDNNILQPSELLYDGTKSFNIHFFYEGTELKFNVQNIKINISSKSIYFILFNKFKNLNSLGSSGIFGESSQFSGYYPSNFYSPYIDSSTSISTSKLNKKRNFWLFKQINNETNLYLNNESQEASDYDTDGNSERNNILKVTPFITTTPLPQVFSYSNDSLKQLQDWFNNPINKYLCDKNKRTKPLNLLRNHLANINGIYITLFPEKFNVEEFKKEGGTYYNNLENKFLPIYQPKLMFSSSKKDSSSISLTQKSYSYFVQANTNKYWSFFKYGLTTSYDKTFISSTIRNMDLIKQYILKDVYNDLIQSIFNSYKYILFKYIKDKDELKIFCEQLLKDVSGIYNPEDLVNFLRFLNIYHDDTKKFEDVDYNYFKNDTRCVIFNIPFKFRKKEIEKFLNINNIKINLNKENLWKKWQSWSGTFMFYEKK